MFYESLQQKFAKTKINWAQQRTQNESSSYQHIHMHRPSLRFLIFYAALGTKTKQNNQAFHTKYKRSLSFDQLQ